MHPATEKQQAYGRFWLARLRESKIARLVGREAPMAEIFQMLADGGGGLLSCWPGSLCVKASPGRWVQAAPLRGWKSKSRQTQWQ